MTAEPDAKAVANAPRNDYSTRHAQARQKKGLGRYRKGRKLGQGAFGTVYQGIDQLTGQFVAIKVIQVEHLNSDEEVRNEFDLLQTLSHDNIVRYFDLELSEDNSVVKIYLEYVDGGSLASVIKQYGRLSEEVCAVYTLHLLRGLQYLHSKGVLHRDIKPANLLVSIDANVKLADFGASKKVETADGINETKFVGTPAYIAPEAIRGKHSHKGDIWSVGCTLLELATGKQPWANTIIYTDVMDFITQIANSDITPNVPKFLSRRLHLFLDRCLQRDPDERADCDELLTHPFLAKANGQETSSEEDYEEWEEVEEEEEEEEEDDDDGRELTSMDELFRTNDLGSTMDEVGLSLGDPALTVEHIDPTTPADDKSDASMVEILDSPDGCTTRDVTPKTNLDVTPRTGPLGDSPAQQKLKSFRIKHVIKSPQFQIMKGGAKPPAEGWFPTKPSEENGVAASAGQGEEEEDEDGEANDLCGLFIAAHHCNDVLATGFFTSFDSRPEHRRQASQELLTPTIDHGTPGLEVSRNSELGASSKSAAGDKQRNYLAVAGTPDGLVTIDLSAQHEADASIPRELRYKFDVFFNESTTPTQLFQRIGSPIIRTLMRGRTMGKKVSITCCGMPYSGKSQTVIGRDNASKRGQMGFLPLIIQKLYEEFGTSHDFYLSSMCCRKEKKGVFDNINHKLLDGVSDWSVLRDEVLQRADTWEAAVEDLDLSKLAFLGVKSPHMLVIEARKKGSGVVQGTLFVTLFYGRQWTYWLNGLTFLVHHYFVYTNSMAGSQSQVLSSGGGDSRMGDLPSQDSAKLKAELRRYVSNEFFGIVEQIYKDPLSMNYVLHNFHGLAAHLDEISSSLSALGSATRQAPRNVIPGSREKET